MIALLVNPNGPEIPDATIRDAQAAARAKGVQLPILKASTESEIDAAFDSLVDLRADALLVGDDPFFGSRREQLVALGITPCVPAIYWQREFAAEGGLISMAEPRRQRSPSRDLHGTDLKGEKPADLPVQQPTPSSW